MVKSSSGKVGLRSFTIVNMGKHGGCKTKFHAGRYLSRNPAGAAKKAFNEHCRKKKIRGVCALTVTVQETTKGSSQKSFTYKLNRMKLKEPIVRLEGTPQQYLIEYGVKAKSSKTPEHCKQHGQTRGRMKKKTSRKTKPRVNNVVRIKAKRSAKNNKSKGVFGVLGL